MPRLYEVRIYEPAVAGGLFPRPKRIRLTNMWAYSPPVDGVLRLYWGDARWEFGDGKCSMYDAGSDSFVPAEIVGEIDKGRAMERDRFIVTEGVESDGN